jgi:hypothetical protein
MNPRIEPEEQDRSLSQACLLICLVGLSLVAGKIAVVRSSTGEVPFLSANDRSRWATVASLVDYRTYQVDHFQALRDPKTKRRAWQSIDRVQHRGADGKIHDYSSKPPLLATMFAVVYAVVKSVTGLGIQQHPFFVGRLVLAMVNLPLLAILMACTVSLVKRYTQSSFTIVFLTTAVAVGTLVTPFAISLNNHLPAATATIAALWFLDSQARHGATIWKMLLCGVAAGFSAAFELPSLALVPLWGIIAMRISIPKASVAFVAGLALVAIPFFATNWVAHQSLRPPYAHRGIGPLVEKIPDEYIIPGATPLLRATRNRTELARALNVASYDVEVVEARSSNWARLNTPDNSYAIVPGEKTLAIHQWDDWYDYPGTYWDDDKLAGVDRGESSRLTYALHALVGHHGIFSLTPLWLVSLCAIPMWFSRDRLVFSEEPKPAAFPQFPIAAITAILLVTVTCMAFYVARPEIDRNYGGVSVALRWMLWLAPLWIFLAIPLVQRLGEVRWGRAICCVLLAFSIFSVAASLENPWTHPWLYRWMDDLGWIANDLED